MRIYRHDRDPLTRQMVRKKIQGEFPPSWDEPDIEEAPGLGGGHYWLQLIDADNHFIGAGRELRIDGRPNPAEDDDDADDGEDAGPGGPVESVEIAAGYTVPIAVGLPDAKKQEYIERLRREHVERESRGKVETMSETVLKALLAKSFGGGDDDWKAERRRLEGLLDEERRALRAAETKASEALAHATRQHEAAVAEARRDAREELREAKEEHRAERRRLEAEIDDVKRRHDKEADDLRRRASAELEQLQRLAADQVKLRDEQIAALRRENLGASEAVLKERYKKDTESTLEKIVGAAAPMLAPMVERMTAPPPQLVAAQQAAQQQALMEQHAAQQHAAQQQALLEQQAAWQAQAQAQAQLPTKMEPPPVATFEPTPAPDATNGLAAPASTPITGGVPSDTLPAGEA